MLLHSVIEASVDLLNDGSKGFNTFSDKGLG